MQYYKVRDKNLKHYGPETNCSTLLLSHSGPCLGMLCRIIWNFPYQNAFAQIFFDPIGSWNFYESVNIPYSGNVVLHEGFEASLFGQHGGLWQI